MVSDGESETINHFAPFYLNQLRIPGAGGGLIQAWIPGCFFN
jgi:hypothetical protein